MSSLDAEILELESKLERLDRSLAVVSAAVSFSAKNKIAVGDDAATSGRSTVRQLPPGVVIAPGAASGVARAKPVPMNERRMKEEFTVAAPAPRSGFAPRAGTILPYTAPANSEIYDEDLRTLRAYLRDHLISQADYVAQRDVMLHAWHGGMRHGYQGSNFTHHIEFKEIDAKRALKKNEGKRG